MRDFLAATRDRVIVFDGSMGATLEQYDLSLEDDYKLPGRCHEALVLNRPDVIEQLHASMIEAGAEVVETDTFQGSRLKLEEWGLGERDARDQPPRRRDRPQGGRRGALRGRLDRPDRLPPRLRRPDARRDPLPRPRRRSSRSRSRGLLEGGVDLIIIETAQDILEVKAAVFGAREAFKATGRAVPIQTSVSLLPNGGKMLLGTDISAALATLEALDVDVIGLNCSTGPEDMRDAVRFLGEHCPTPIHCIPNAGIPHQGPDGETIFPAEPEPLAEVLGDFVERYGLGIVGGCCGTTTEHIRAIAERCTHHHPKARPAPRPIHVSSMMTATPLVQEPAPTIVGERVNSQGSRKAKEMLLADDYDGLVTVAEDQVEGGAHVLDLCVALTERQDEDEQMRLVAKKVALTQPAPIQVDSTEPDVIATALDQIPGRAIVNSVNLEAGRDKLDKVVPMAKAHGAALIALTIDEVGMAKTRDRKLEIAQRIKELVCDEHGLDPEALIFDALTFTLTTGDDEWKPSAVETIEGIRLIKSELPGVKTSLGVSNVSFGIGVPARSVLNSVFLHHCVEAGLDLAMVNPNHITPYGEIPDEERKLADDLVFNRSDEALQHFIEHFESKSGEDEAEVADPTADMTPAGGAALAHPAPQAGGRGGADRRLGRGHRRGADAQRRAAAGHEGGRRQVRRRRADPAVRPAVGRGHEARRRPARAVPREDRGLHEGHRRARDRVRRRARHRQVARQHDPHQQRLHGHRPRQAGPDRDDPRRRRGAQGDRHRPLRAARLDLQADAAGGRRAARARPRLPGADRRRRHQPQVRPARQLPEGQGLRRTSTSPASSTARTPSRASA